MNSSLHFHHRLSMHSLNKGVSCFALFLSLLLFNVQEVKSQTIPINLKVYFRQNVATLEPAYRDNAWRLDDFVTTILNEISDSTYTIQEITITSGASPEGPFDHNIWLSQNRGYALREYLAGELGVSESLFTINALGEDWEGFRRLVQQYKVPNKEKVLNIIDEYLRTPVKNQDLSARCKTAIGNIDGSKTSDYIYENIYPELRNASNSVVCYLRPVVRRDTVVDRVVTVKERDTLYVVMPTTHVKDTVYMVMPMGFDGDLMPEGKPAARAKKVRKEHNYHFAAKTNLLFDLTTALNVELEFPIKNKVSIMLEHNFPWWLPTFGDENYAMELLRTGLEARYWLGDRTNTPILTGWFVGAYSSADYYDFEWKNMGWQGETFLDFGVSGGYSFKIAENWRIETSLALGYFRSNYTEYDHRTDLNLLVYQKDDTFSWIGPTKLKCSISWILPNYPTEKSQARKAAKAKNKNFSRTGK